MKNLRCKGYKRHHGYIPVHTNPSKKKKKKCEFISKSRSTELNKQGIELEKSSITQKNMLFFLGIVTAIVLLILDVKDEGMFFEGLGIKFAGSLVGTIFFILSIIGIWKNKPKVTLE